jgi:hypothetical protein
VHRPTGAFGAACALLTTLLVAGCGVVGQIARPGDQRAARYDAPSGAGLVLLPAAARGPGPFSDATATSPATPPPLTRTPPAARSRSGADPAAALTGVRRHSGGTPGLYAGRRRAADCDVDRLPTADPDRARAFAGAAGIVEAAIPAHLRALTPVVLRADTRVTGHGYRAGRAVAYQAALQAGTAVLVDTRGVPRVRCACGNPLAPPVPTRSAVGGAAGTWAGYRPERVVVVTPAPRAVGTFTIVDIDDGAWVEREVGADVRHDRVMPGPYGAERTDRAASPSVGASPAEDRSAADAPDPASEPSESSESSEPSDPEEPPVLADTASGSPREPGGPADPSRAADDGAGVPEPADAADAVPRPEAGAGDAGPATVPDAPDPPDGGGLVPDAPDEPDGPDGDGGGDGAGEADGSIFGSPTGVFAD